MTQHISAPNTKPLLLLLLLSSVILLFAPWSSVGPTTEAAAPLYQGYHDYVDCNYIAGSRSWFGNTDSRLLQAAATL
jgi:hypothetical protein